MLVVDAAVGFVFVDGHPKQLLKLHLVQHLHDYTRESYPFPL